MITKITYVLGVYKGIVRTVYKPTKWQTYKCADDGTQFKKYVMDLKGFLFLTHPT